MIILLIVLQIILLVLVLRLMSKPHVSRLLSTVLLFYALLWYVIPIGLGLIAGRNALAAALVDDRTFVEFAVIETLSLVVTLLFLFRPKPYFGSIVRQSIGPIEMSPRLALVVLLGGLVFSSVASSQFRGLLGTAYLDQNAAPTTALGEEWFGAYGSFGFVQSILMGFAYVCLTMKWPQRSSTSYLVVLAALALVANTTLNALLGGSRIAMLILPLLLVAHAREHAWPVKKMLLIAVSLLLVLLPIGASFTVAIVELRGREFTAGSVIAYSQDMLSDTGRTQSLGGAMVDQVIEKFDSISMGAFLVKALGAGSAGWKPYEGAFEAVIPRMILPSKPVPGSIDGTFWGHPSRLVPTLSGIGSESSSVGVSPAAVTIWQFGFGGLPFLVIANIFYLYLLNSFLLSTSYVSRTLGMSLLGIPSLVALFSSPDVVIMNTERALVIFVFALVASKLLSGRSQRAPAFDRTHTLSSVLDRQS